MNFYISYFYFKKTCFFFLSHLASNNSRKTMSGLFAVKHSCEAPFFASDHVIKKKKTLTGTDKSIPGTWEYICKIELNRTQ